MLAHLQGVPSLTCACCGREVWPRLGSYWFLLLSPRGRCRFPGAAELRVVLCGPCGRRCRDLLESNGFDPSIFFQSATGPPS